MSQKLKTRIFLATVHPSKKVTKTLHGAKSHKNHKKSHFCSCSSRFFDNPFTFCKNFCFPRKVFNSKIQKGNKILRNRDRKNVKKSSVTTHTRHPTSKNEFLRNMDAYLKKKIIDTWVLSKKSKNIFSEQRYAKSFLGAEMLSKTIYRNRDAIQNFFSEQG